MRFLKRYCRVVATILLVMMTFAGCYSAEEKEQAKTYEKQGTRNAVAYIKEKYGFEAKVTDAECERAGDFDPAPGEAVFVTMEWEGKTFTVQIDGDCETTEGFDNYQQEEIADSLEGMLEELTGLSQEEVFVFYGECRGTDTLEDNRNGLVAPFFNGENSKEILSGGSVATAVVVSYINQNVKGVDADAVKEEIGATELLLVDYDSKEHYETITQPWYNAEGTPIEGSINHHYPYINSYMVSDLKETVYIDCKKITADGILFVTEHAEETVTVEKISGFTYELSPKSRKPVSDVYAMTTGADEVDVYVPTDMLTGTGGKTPGIIVMMGEKEIHTVSNLTNDGKYVGATIYRRDYEGPIEFSVYVREE